VRRTVYLTYCNVEGVDGDLVEHGEGGSARKGRDRIVNVYEEMVPENSGTLLGLLFLGIRDS